MLIHFYDFAHNIRIYFHHFAVICYQSVDFILHVGKLSVHCGGEPLFVRGLYLPAVELVKGLNKLLFGLEFL